MKLPIKFNGEAIYRIEVLGELSEKWSDSLGSLSIAVKKENDMTLSVIEGLIVSQAQLADILRNLHEMHYSILNVTCLS